MNLEQTTRWRNGIGKVCALFCAIFMLAIFDGLISHFRQPENVFELLPGEETDINGSFKESVASVEELEYAGNSDLMQVSFEAVHAGFWVGGQMWRGKLKIDPRIQAGQYTLTVNRKGEAGKKPSSVFIIKVYADHESYRRSSLSLIQRYLDVSPWWVFSFFLPAALLALGAVYWASHKRDECLAAQGKAEIYHIAQGPSEYEVTFGLGSKHGLQVGDLLAVLDENGIVVGSVIVKQVAETDSAAVTGLDCPVKTGYTIFRA